MKTHFLVRAIVLFALACTPVASTSQINRTKVFARDHMIKPSMLHGESHVVEIDVTGALKNTRLVVLLRFKELQGFYVAKNEKGDPVAPLKLTQSESRLQSPSLGSISRWRSQFVINQTFPKMSLEEIYIIACEVLDRTDSTPDRDYSNFQYLPFNRSLDTEAALVLLRDFGWRPTGFTKIAA